MYLVDESDCLWTIGEFLLYWLKIFHVLYHHVQIPILLELVHASEVQNKQTTRSKPSNVFVTFDPVQLTTTLPETNDKPLTKTLKICHFEVEDISIWGKYYDKNRKRFRSTVPSPVRVRWDNGPMRQFGNYTLNQLAEPPTQMSTVTRQMLALVWVRNRTVKYWFASDVTINYNEFSTRKQKTQNVRLCARAAK